MLRNTWLISNWQKSQLATPTPAAGTIVVGNGI